jgi:hypothetical protein
MQNFLPLVREGIPLTWPSNETAEDKKSSLRVATAIIYACL